MDRDYWEEEEIVCVLSIELLMKCLNLVAPCKRKIQSAPNGKQILYEHKRFPFQFSLALEKAMTMK